MTRRCQHNARNVCDVTRISSLHQVVFECDKLKECRETANIDKMEHSLACIQNLTCNVSSPIFCKSRGADNSAGLCGAPEPSLQERFIDFYDSESPCEKNFSGDAENFAYAPPRATAPPLDDADDELTAFAKSRTQTRDAMIQVEGIPKMLYIMVDFSKWGSPSYREMLKKRNDKRKIKKVSFSEPEVNEVFTASQTFYLGQSLKASVTEYNTRLKSFTTEYGHSVSQLSNNSPKQAFGLRKKPALYVLDKLEHVNVFSV
jgi:hypothetical protein